MMDTAEFDAMLLAMRTITDQLAEAPNSKITLKEAAYVAGVTEAQMRKRCEDNRYAVDPGGYGYKKVGRWEVVIAPFVKSLPVSALARFRDVKEWMIG